MPILSLDDIRYRFEFGGEFNELFDAFGQALKQRYDDLDLYKILFWNKGLSPDEILLFALKLTQEFPDLAYETYIFLGEMFSITSARDDNYERALMMYQKAAKVRPEENEPYLKAADCYDPDVKIPPLEILIGFLKDGLEPVKDSKPLCKKLSEFYALLNNEELTKYYLHLSGEGTGQAPTA